MKIDNQKWTRAIPCFIVVFLLLSFSVFPASAAPLTEDGYQFNRYISPPHDEGGEIITGASPFKGRTADGTISFRYIRWVPDYPDSKQNFAGKLYFDDTLVWSFFYAQAEPHALTSAIMHGSFMNLVLDPGQDLSPGLHAWLHENGTFIDNFPMIDTPDIDVGDLVPDTVLDNVMPTFAAVFASLWNNANTVVLFLSVTVSLCIISFLIFGSKR